MGWNTVVRVQMSPNVRTELHGIGVQVYLVLADDDVRLEERTIRYVVAANVQQPRDFVQSRHNHSVAPQGFDFISSRIQFVFPSLACFFFYNVTYFFLIKMNSSHIYYTYSRVAITRKTWQLEIFFIPLGNSFPIN